MHLVSVSGSSSARSRSGWLLQRAQTRLEQQATHIDAIAKADVMLIATPIHKAAYSGLLKTFLDLLPGDGLRGKTVLPLATGGSCALSRAAQPASC